MLTIDLLASAPQRLTVDAALVAAAIDATAACSTACTACASACLVEPEVADMVTCIRDGLDCADICSATSRHLTRLNASDKQLTQSLLATCVQACVQCAASCAPHVEVHDHCRLCHEACRQAEQACQALLNALKTV